MKKLKLIFGLLMVAAFVAISILSYTSTDSQAISKEEAAKYIPRQG